MKSIFDWLFNWIWLLVSLSASVHWDYESLILTNNKCGCGMSLYSCSPAVEREQTDAGVGEDEMGSLAHLLKVLLIFQCNIQCTSLPVKPTYTDVTDENDHSMLVVTSTTGGQQKLLFCPCSVTLTKNWLLMVPYGKESVFISGPLSTLSLGAESLSASTSGPSPPVALTTLFLLTLWICSVWNSSFYRTDRVHSAHSHHVARDTADIIHNLTLAFFHFFFCLVSSSILLPSIGQQLFILL